MSTSGCCAMPTDSPSSIQKRACSAVVRSRTATMSASGRRHAGATLATAAARGGPLRRRRRAGGRVASPASRASAHLRPPRQRRR